VDFFDAQELSLQISALSDDENKWKRLGQSASKFAVKHYDVKTVKVGRKHSLKKYQYLNKSGKVFSIINTVNAKSHYY